MEFWNYCPNCGKRLIPGEEFCPQCGKETISDSNRNNYFFTPPIHNIGFFNLKIDFSPYINTNSDFKYTICSCGYLNEIGNGYCHHCGKKRKRIISRFINIPERSTFNINDFINKDEIICECGAVNSKDSEFCDMCGQRLHEEPKKDDDININYQLKYENSIFCCCGQENSGESQFCENCGLPLDHYDRINDMKVLCVCSVLNEITSDFCMECGNDLNNEIKEIICVCGTRNSLDSRFCSSCQKPLNPERIITSKLVCSCGQIMNFNSDFCPNCGKNIKKIIKRKKTFSRTVKSVKDVLNGV